MKYLTKLQKIKKQRIRRVRAKVSGSAKRPRLAVYRSNKFMYVQLIDDITGKTVVSASDVGLKDKTPKAERAATVGERIAKKSLEAGIKEAVFDKRAYSYHGRVKAVADAARKAGLKI